MTRLDALNALAEMVEAGKWDHSHTAPARIVFPYKSAAVDDLGLTALEAFQGSLDAALELHKAVLPGWDWLARNEPCGAHSEIGFANVTTRDFSAFCAVCDEHGNTVSKSEVISGASFPVYSETPARAWLLAILRALIAQETAE